MSDSVRTVVRESLRRAVEAAQSDGLLAEGPSQISLEQPKRPEHGDYATNLALGLAKANHKPPRALQQSSRRVHLWTRLESSDEPLVTQFIA
jgi:arginyl-tRNA synthetase